MPAISVIIPVYKAECYIGPCLDSILSQTFQDFEIVAVDDGSPDGSYAICREYAEKDERIRVLHQENRGQAAARNHGLQYAAGELICFVDSDDLIHPQMLEFLHQAVQESGAGISMCQFLESPFLPENYAAPRTPGYTVHTMDDAGLCALYDRDLYPGWVACAKLIRRDLVERYPFTVGRVYEDNEAVCRWLCQGDRLAWMEQDLYFYRTNPGSTTQREFSVKRLDYLWALESITRFFGECGFSGMKDRFGQRYIEAAIQACYGTENTLRRHDLTGRVERQARRFLREQGIGLTREQQDGLMDAAHPKLVKYYWPIMGLARTLRDGGLEGLAAKLRKRRQNQ